MTSERDTARIVRAWLEDGATVLPDRVLDAVEGLLPQTRQRRGPLAQLLPFSSGTGLRLGVAAAVAVAAVVVAVWLLPGGRAPVGEDPTPTPAPATRLQAQPTIPAGTYFVDDPFPVPATFVLDGPWENNGMASTLDETVAGVCRGSCDPPAGSGFGVWIVDDAPADACRHEFGGSGTLGPTVDDLVAVLAAQPGDVATEVTDVVLDGYRGKHLRLVGPADPSACNGDHLVRWYAGEHQRDALAREHDEVWVLDVDGVRVVVDIFWFDDTPPEDVAALRDIVQSLTFPGPPGQ